MKQEHLLAETLVPFDAGKKLLGKPTRSQLCYWRSTGLKVSGQPKRVRLECLRIGGRPFTSLDVRFVSPSPVVPGPKSAQKTQ